MIDFRGNNFNSALKQNRLRDSGVKFKRGLQLAVAPKLDKIWLATSLNVFFFYSENLPGQPAAKDESSILPVSAIFDRGFASDVSFSVLWPE